MVNNRYCCHVNSWFTNGVVKSEQKFALTALRPFGRMFSKHDTVEAALNRLSANIEYWPFNPDDQFKGSFKLKSDPKIQDLTS